MKWRMKMKADIEYTNSGMFTRFYPNTSAGEAVWREMAKQDGVAAVLSFEAKKTIAQIRAAGYTVAKAKKPTESVDDILAELGV
jgi:hypothetical protein